jgi:hypothetical protein
MRRAGGTVERGEDGRRVLAEEAQQDLTAGVPLGPAADVEGLAVDVDEMVGVRGCWLSHAGSEIHQVAAAPSSSAIAEGRCVTKP